MKFADLQREYAHHATALNALKRKAGSEAEYRLSARVRCTVDVHLSTNGGESAFGTRTECFYPYGGMKPNDGFWEHTAWESLTGPELARLGELRYQFERWRDGLRDAPPTAEEWNSPAATV